MLLENYNIFKAWIIENVLLPKWNKRDKQKVLYDDDIDIIIEFCRDRKFYDELKNRVGVVSKTTNFSKKDSKSVARLLQGNSNKQKANHTYNYTIYSDSKPESSKQGETPKPFDFSANLINWKAAGSRRVASNSIKKTRMGNHSQMSNKQQGRRKMGKSKNRIRNIRVLGHYDDDSNTHSESKSETMMNGLTVFQRSNSSISKASSQNSRSSFVGFKESLIIDTKAKRHSYFPTKEKFKNSFNRVLSSCISKPTNLEPKSDLLKQNNEPIVQTVFEIGDENSAEKDKSKVQKEEVEEPKKLTYGLNTEWSYGHCLNFIESKIKQNLKSKKQKINRPRLRRIFTPENNTIESIRPSTKSSKRAHYMSPLYCTRKECNTFVSNISDDSTHITSVKRGRNIFTPHGRTLPVKQHFSFLSKRLANMRKKVLAKPNFKQKLTRVKPKDRRLINLYVEARKNLKSI